MGSHYTDGHWLTELPYRCCPVHRIDSHYHAWGLQSSRDPPTEAGRPEYVSFPEMVQRLGHAGRRIDIFKIDCEGCEYRTYPDWLNAGTDIRQVLIEVHAGHRLARDVPASRFFQAFWDQGLLAFAKEANTHPFAKPTGTLFEFGFLKLARSFFNVTASSGVI